MQILSDFNKDTQTQRKESGSYEWWYFDLLTTDGYSVVIIFYEGNPFSRRYISELNHGQSASPGNYPAISLSVYKQGKPLFYLFDECEPSDAGFSSEQPEGFVKGNSFKGESTSDGYRYSIRLNQELPSGDKIDASLSFLCNKWDAAALLNQTAQIGEDHIWNLISPRCGVIGEIKIWGYKEYEMDIEGIGYHDHNVGFEPMKDSFTEWYWGRYHLPNSTLVYYLMNEHNKWKYKAWLITEGEKIRSLKTQIDVSDLQTNMFGLKSSRVFTFFDDETELFLQKDRVTDNGPFYQRFEGRLIAKSGGDTIEECRGISEYIYPSRIYDKRFWPLVNMRIAYPGKKHWVQKNPVLYRWTW